MADTEEFLNTSGAMILAIMPYIEISPKELYEKNSDVFDSTHQYFRNIVTELSDEDGEVNDVDCDIFKLWTDFYIFNLIQLFQQ